MAQTQPLPPLIGGRYRPLRLIGKGGMGAVYAVEHAHTGELLALKVMNLGPNATADKVERFKREARVSARIKSEHVVRVLDADVSLELGGVPFLVMELLDGADLGHHCGDQPQPPEVVIEWLRQAARALEKAHSQGLIHRDLKPENIFLSRREDGSPLIKILDFGLVTPLPDDIGSTNTGEILGTPLYMAPEQARGQRETVGIHTDLWALGLVAFRLLMGKDYWVASTITQLLGLIVYEPMVLPSARGAPWGEPFDAWFSRACAREPEKRFRSAEEQVEALAATLGLPTSFRPSAKDLAPLSLRSRLVTEQAATLTAPASNPEGPSWRSTDDTITREDAVQALSAQAPRRSLLPWLIGASVALCSVALLLFAKPLALVGASSPPGNSAPLLSSTSPSAAAPPASATPATSSAPAASSAPSVVVSVAPEREPPAASGRTTAAPAPKPPPHASVAPATPTTPSKNPSHALDDQH